MTRHWSRRDMLRRTAALGAAAVVPIRVWAQAAASTPRILPAAETVTLEAMVARLIPSDANGPGALEAGAARYIDRALGDALASLRGVYVSGLAALNAYASQTEGQPFAQLAPERQDSVLRDLEQNRATGFASGAAAFFELVLEHTLEGTFGDPHYGGNQDFIGWNLVGYPGIHLAVTAEQQRMDAVLEPLRQSAYDLGVFEAHASAEDRHGD
jgi:gluconate 2-dehydrogenase gamma chain